VSDEAKGVTNVDFCVPWRSHSTFEAAVAAVPAQRREAARIVNRRLRGSLVNAFSFDGTRVVLLMSTGDELILAATAVGVTFELNRDAMREDPDAAFPEQMRIRFPQGLECDWSWRPWVQQLVGKEFWAISPSETIVYLQIRGAKELLFDSLVNLDSGKRFLYFDEP